MCHLGPHARDQGVEANLDEIDAGEGDDDVTSQDDTGAEQPIEEIDERDLPGRRNGGTVSTIHVRHQVSRTAKE